MSTNNFPLVWNSEADDGLLGSLFPQGNNFNSGLSESTVDENQNPFASSPLSKNGSDLKNHFFIRSKLFDYGNIEIIIDPSSKQNPADKIKIIEQNFIIENKGGNRSLDEGEKAFRVKLFICKDSNQLKTIFDNGTVIPDKNEILLFLEDNSGDWSGTTMYLKKGANVNNSNFFDKLFSKNSEFTSFINSQYNISKSDLQELLRKDKVESNALNLISALFGAVSYLVSSPILIKSIAFGIETAIEAIKKNCSISEKSWNPANTEEGTAFQPLFFIGIPTILDSIDDSKINAHLKEAIKKLKTESNDYHQIIEKSLLMISKTPVAAVFPFPFNTLALLPNDNSFSIMLLAKYRELRKTIDASIDELEKIDFTDIIKQSVYAVNAFICGIWNGFVEAVCGIFSLVQYLFEGAGEIADLLENFKEKGPQLLEQIDNCIMAFQELDFSRIFVTLASNIKDWALSESTTSIVEIAYFSGMFIGFVVELAIEIAVGIIFTGGLLTIETIMAKLGETFKALGGLLIGALKLPFKVAEKSIASLVKSLKWLYEFLSKGTDEIIKLMDEVFAKFRSLGDEVLENFKKIKERAKSIFSKETKYDALYRDITKKFFISNKGIMSEKQFFKLASKIAESFKVEMILVDRNSEKFAELFAKWEKNPVYAVFHESTFVNGRYGIVLEGPAIYFFKGNVNVNYVRQAIEITSYTVQHELLHLKLWHKMVVEFPEMATLYKRIPRVLDEMNVIGEMLKQNNRKIAKWEIDDILNDLAIINDNIKRYPSWKEHSRKIFGKEKYELKDFENWDLGKYLKDL